MSNLDVWLAYIIKVLMWVIFKTFSDNNIQWRAEKAYFTLTILYRKPTKSLHVGKLGKALVYSKRKYGYKTLVNHYFEQGFILMNFYVSWGTQLIENTKYIITSTTVIEG